MNLCKILAEKALKRLSESESVRSGNAIVYGGGEFLSDIYKLLQVDDYYSVGVQYLCFACEKPPKDSFNIALLNQCINSARIFLYKNMLNLDVEDDCFESAQRAFYYLDDNTLLTKEQKELFDLFNAKRRLVVSAPTSFGKSRVMREIIAANKYESIAIVVPTNALLSETFQCFRLDERFYEYDIVFSTHTEPVRSGKAIYIFTPEKFDVYTDEFIIKFDFFIFDEVYKIDSSDGRSSVFSSCLYKAYKQNCDYYLIGPYFNKFSSEFLEKTNGFFKKFETEIVRKEVFHYYTGEKISIESKEYKKLVSKERRLKEVVKKIDGQTIVYVSKRRTAETQAHHISLLYENVVLHEELVELIEYISKTISSDWGLVGCLRKGVAFHHAGVPKYIQSEVVDLFNKGILNIIVCTPTLTEGVNTSAKNVVFFDTKKNDVDLSGFEVKNIIGRSGRFGHHFVGRAIFLESHQKQENIGSIQYPIFDYAILPDEDYIRIDKNDLHPEGKLRYDIVLSKLQDQRIPAEILAKNKYIPLENQINLISVLRKDYSIRDALWGISSLPQKNQVDLLVQLIYEELMPVKDRKKGLTHRNLARLVKFQIYRNPSLKDFIESNGGESIDTKIRNALDIVYKYFDFKLPKYIGVFQNIFNFVYGANMNLSVFSTYLQYGNDKKSNILLMDAGVPKSIISHLEPYLDNVYSYSAMREVIDNNRDALKGLSSLEIKMLSKRI